MADTDEIARRFREMGDDQHVRSPMVAQLCRHAAETPELIALLGAAPAEQQLPVLLLAAVHWLVLADPTLELARYYPTVTRTPFEGDPFPTFLAFCRDRESELRSIVEQRRTQTNEVGRSALFLPALELIAREQGPLGIVDVGTSAGLNLHLDRYAYRYRRGRSVDTGGGAGELGSSPVTIDVGTRGDVPVPCSMPTIAERAGIDRSPIDVGDPAEARWLMACVWPDQLDRFERLQAAIAIAARHPVAIRNDDAVAGLRPVIDTTAAHPVVLNSWVLNYLDDGARSSYVAELDSIGADRDLSWIHAESPALCPGVPFGIALEQPGLTALTLVTWRGGRREVRHLGVAHPHGYWLHWHDA